MFGYEKYKVQLAALGRKLDRATFFMSSIIGTGNVWRFPMMLAVYGRKGGLIFILVWLLLTFIWTSPIIILECALARYTTEGVLGSFRHLFGSRFLWMAAWICLVLFFITSYYCVVIGWSMYYFCYFLINPLPTAMEESHKIFEYFTTSNWCFLTQGLCILLASVSVLSGYKLIEKANRILVPFFLFTLLYGFFTALFQSQANLGIQLMFKPDWESLANVHLWIGAMGQNAFDTWACTGILTRISAFASPPIKIVRYSILIPASNNVISILAGMMLFIIAMSSITFEPFVTTRQTLAGVYDTNEYESLLFVWAPMLYMKDGVFGRILLIIFFFSLTIGGITQMIASIEVLLGVYMEFGRQRILGVIIISCAMFLMGVPSVLYKSFLWGQDYSWTFGTTMSGLMFITVALGIGIDHIREKIINIFKTDWHLPKAWNFMIKVVCPLEITILVIWWLCVIIIGEPPDVNKLKLFSEWIIVMFFLVLMNGLYLLCVKYLRHHFVDEEENIIFQPEEIYRKYSTNVFHENEEVKDITKE